MGATTSDQVIDILVQAGVKRAFGVPGDATDLMLASIHNNDAMDFFLTRHEEAAGFMASAQAKLTGELGVVLACQGPGAAHMLNAMYDAKMDKVPMLVITGQIETHVIGTNTVQEIDQLSLFSDVAFYNREVRTANNLVDVLQLAIQTAITKRCVSHVSIATDVLRLPHTGKMPNAAVFDMPYQVRPEESAIKKAADVLNRKQNVTILYGGGTRCAVDELLAVADLLQAPMVHTVRSKEIVDNNNPHYAGGIGMKGSRNGCHFVKHCDALLVVGCSFAWRSFYPEKAPIVQIDIDPQRMGIRSNLEVGLIGDAKVTLAQLAAHLHKKSDNQYLTDAQRRHHKAIAALDKKSQIKEKGISSPFVTAVISENMEDDAIVTVDAGTVSVWANNWLRMNGKHRLIGSTELGTLGFGLPAAIGCQIAQPDKQVIALCGDGGVQMTIGDFATAVKYDLPVNIVVYNNFSYHFIELEQMKEGVAQCYTKLANPDYAKLADAFGGEGFSVKQPGEMEGAIRCALASPKPCIIDVHVNPEELIHPTKITAEMLVSFTKGMIKTKLSGTKD